MAIAPEKIPSGGGFSIKNFTLEALYSENKYLRNIWTQTNNNLPLMRFCGAKITCYRSLHTDYILSWGNSLPMGANLEMYQSMHPGIHGMIKNKILVPRKRENQYKKPYITFRTRPPNPLINKWYFQQDMAKIPLLQIRASACSFDQYYTDYRAISTTINIFFLNIGLIQNSNFKQIPPAGYSPRQNQGKKIYLYYIKPPVPTGTQTIKIENIKFLGNTNLNQPGEFIPADITPENIQTKYPQSKWGNPFYKNYMQKTSNIYMSETTLANLINNKSSIYATWFTETHMAEAIRYNPFRDQGTGNKIWIQSIKQDSNGWNPPEEPSIYVSSFLPLWVLAYGFEDFQKKNNRVTNIDTDYMVVIQTNFDKPTITQTLPIIDVQFMQGKSPYEDAASPLDFDRWYPSLQMQQQTITSICSSGPGSPKQAPLNSIEAKIKYCFYFKWGGNPPPMETITDPKDQPEIHIPTNLQQTNSLQNPANDPAMYLYNFDERRQFLTKAAIKRLQKDFSTKTTSITDGNLFQAPIQTYQESSEEETSEEEEETTNLLLKLRNQRRKHKLLKLKILEKMGILPT